MKSCALIARSLAVVVCLCLAAASARAEVKLPAIISNNMVLQAGKELPIWGTAAAGEKVTVTLGEKSAAATADAAGKWQVKLPALPAGGPLSMTVAGENTLTVNNILVGSVWVCSGQSNMAFGLSGAHNAASEIPQANHPRIRLFTVPRKIALQPQSDCQGVWVECTPETAARFSAVGYFFGRDLQQATDVPVGLIHSSWGGTPAQAWTSLSGLEKDAELADYVSTAKNRAANYEKAKLDYPARVAAHQEKLKKWQEEVGKPFQQTMAQWQEATKAAKAAGAALPPRPQPSKPQPPAPEIPEGSAHTPTGLFNAMIAPLVPFAIDGVIWYQGEGNASAAVQYRTLFARMITDWREHWGQGDFAFLYVQLANYTARSADPNTPSSWAMLRDAQTRTLKLPNTGMAVIIDVGDGADIHPRDKMDVGRRLSLWARKLVFAQDLVASGPLYRQMKVEGDKIRVEFDHVGTGLTIAAAPTTRPGVEPEKPLAELTGFAIAGADGKFVWAQASIDGQGVLVWSEKVPKPTAVRYAWGNNPVCNLYNREGLPASPFRSDGDSPQ